MIFKKKLLNFQQKFNKFKQGIKDKRMINPSMQFVSQ